MSNLSIKQLLQPLPHKLQVKFAYYCANDVRHLLKDKRSIDALDVVDRWLRDEATDEEVAKARDSANAAYYAAATNVADTTTNAVYYAAYVAAYADDVYVTATADAAASAATNNKGKKLQEYRLYLIKMIDELSELEKIVYFGGKYESKV